MLTKTLPVQIKVDPSTAEQGIVEMVVSTYQVDSWGDQVIPGAFADTIADWKSRGDTMPFVFAHQSADPRMYIGSVLDMKEQAGDISTVPVTPAGLWIKSKMDLGEPMADKAFELLKTRRVTQASFAYDVVEGASVQKDGENIFELRKVNLYEAGPCLIGMNQGTELVNVKALQEIAQHLKVGRTISAKNEELLRSAYDAIGSVLGALDDGGDGGKAGQSDGIKTEEPPGAKAEDSPVNTAALSALERELELANLPV